MFISEADQLPRDNQRDREQQTILKSISSHRERIPVYEQLSTDQFDPWQFVPRQVFTPYSRLFISTAFVIVSPVGCLGVIGRREGDLHITLTAGPAPSVANMASTWHVRLL